MQVTYCDNPKCKAVIERVQDMVELQITKFDKEGIPEHDTNEYCKACIMQVALPGAAPKPSKK